MVKNLPANAGDADSVLGSGRSHGVGNGNSLQYSYLENPMKGESVGPYSIWSQRVGHD